MQFGLENETGFQSTEGATHTAPAFSTRMKVFDIPAISYQALIEPAFGTMPEAGQPSIQLKPFPSINESLPLFAPSSDPFL